MKHSTSFRILLAALVGWAFLAPVSAQTIPAPREATAAQATAGTAGHVYISPRRLAGNDITVSDLYVAGDNIYGVLGLNIGASQTTNKALTLFSTGTANILFKADTTSILTLNGSTLSATFAGAGSFAGAGDFGGDLTVTGGILVGAATGGMPSDGVINAEGLKINGVDVSTSSDTYWVADAPGIKYTAGPISLTGTPTGDAGDIQAGVATASSVITNTITGAAANMTVTAGTGNSRTMTLKTTTSGGTATNALVLGADQSATVTGNITAAGLNLNSSAASRAPAQSLLVDGTAGATVSAATVIPGKKWTLTFPLCLSALPATYYTVCDGATDAPYVYINASGDMKIDRKTSAANVLTVSAAVVATQKQIFTYIHDGTNLKLYSGNQEIGTVADTADWAGALSYFCKNAGGGEIMVGEIGVPHCLNRAISTTELAAYIQSGVFPASDYPATPAGTALVTGDDSTFDSDTSFWTKGTGATIGLGVCTLTETSGYIYHVGLVPLGEGGIIRVVVNSNTGTLRVTDGLGTASTLGTGTGVLEVVHTQTGASGSISIEVLGGTAEIDTATIEPAGALLSPDPDQPGYGSTWRGVAGTPDLTLAAGVQWGRKASGTASLDAITPPSEILTINGAQAVRNTSDAAAFKLLQANSASAGWSQYASNAGALEVTRIGGNVAVSYDLNGNATFLQAGTQNLGTVNVTGVITGGAGNMTVTAGTGNSRTLTLRTTTSGGTATDALVLDATQGASLTGSLAINTDKFTVAASTGNTLAAGTLSATGDFKVNTDKFTVTAASGNTLAAGTLSATGDFKVNTDKFTVTAASGNTAVAGTLGAIGDFAVNTDKFTVTAASGNTLAAGTLSSTGDLKVNTDKFVVTAASGNTAIAGTLGATGDFKVNTDKFTVTAASGNTLAAGTLSSTGTFAVNTDKFTANATTGNIVALGTVTAGSGATVLTDAAGKVLTAALNTVGVAQGGTGATTLTANNVILGNGTSAVQLVAPGTSGNVLTSDGTTWASTAQHAATYAEIYVTGASTAQSIATGSTPTKLTAFTTDGESANCTAAAASDKITITSVGVYCIIFDVSFTSDTNNVTWLFEPFVDGSATTKAAVTAKSSTGSDPVNAGRSCLVNVSSAPVDLDIRAYHNSVGTVLLTPSSINLNVVKIH